MTQMTIIESFESVQCPLCEGAGAGCYICGDTGVLPVLSIRTTSEGAANVSRDNVSHKG